MQEIVQKGKERISLLPVAQQIRLMLTSAIDVCVGAVLMVIFHHERGVSHRSSDGAELAV
jgi:hypothetical protein